MMGENLPEFLTKPHQANTSNKPAEIVDVLEQSYFEMVLRLQITAGLG